MAADGSAEDMSRAIDAARRAFDDDRLVAPTPNCGCVCIRQLRDAMKANVEQLRELTIAEVGAPRMLTSMAQLEGPVEDLSFSADTAESYEWRQDLGVAVADGDQATRRTIAREAVGVVGAITPWNFPHQINLAKIGPALAAGNTIVLKPAPDTPWCAAVLGELIAEHTDFPPGVVNIVTSSDHAVGALLSSDPRVDMVSFTGSTNTGRAVMAAGAATIKKVFLELGGKSAFLVLDDADLAGACSMSAFTASMHAGQGCAITTRLVVPRARYDEAAVEAAAATMAGSGARRPEQPRNHLRPSDFRARSATGCSPTSTSRSPRAAGSPAAAGRPGRPRQGLLHRADRDRRTGQQRAGGTRGDLRSGADGHRPRR